MLHQLLGGTSKVDPVGGTGLAGHQLAGSSGFGVGESGEAVSVAA